MTTWWKALLVLRSTGTSTALDRSFAEHLAAMAGYVCAGYDSRQAFFAEHLERESRYRYFHEFLLRHLRPGSRCFSVASGRAANELKLIEMGFTVVCSDLETVCPGQTAHLFPEGQFMRWDCMSDPLPTEPFDAAMALSFIYLLDRTSLEMFFGRMAAVLKPDGVMVLDGPGAPDAAIPNVWHRYWLPLEARLARPFVNASRRLRGLEPKILILKHHGYRHSDQDIVDAARAAGFTLTGREDRDFETEWTRSIAYRYVGRHLPPVRWVCLRIGTRMPHVRMFAFRKASLS